MMPRKQRIEFAGAVYHVISRGNCRKELFTDEQAAGAFEHCLFETVERCGWRLHAYVIMSNHYHLVVETPQPNLVDGMRWLQSTFATRFNRLRGERGHVFQGRYKSIVIGEERSLLGLVDYVHLNPVRAGLCAVGDLRGYRLSSYPKFFRKDPGPGLSRTHFLRLLDLPDSPAGMRRYQKHLILSEAVDPKERERLLQSYCRGWFIGSPEQKQALAESLAKQHSEVEWEGVDLQELKEAQWERLVAGLLRDQQKDEADLAHNAKGSPWKIEIARCLRQQSTASNPWIARRLKMGHPSRVSNLISNKQSI